MSEISGPEHATLRKGDQSQMYEDREEVVKAAQYLARSELDAGDLMELPDGQTTGPHGGLR